MEIWHHDNFRGALLKDMTSKRQWRNDNGRATKLRRGQLPMGGPRKRILVTLMTPAELE